MEKIDELGIDKVHVWRKGFLPPAKCPVCSGVWCLTFTGERQQDGTHVYHCSSCTKTIGAPTSYAYCNRTNEVIEKDIYYTSCLQCPHNSPMEGSPQCKWWQAAQEGDIDTKIRKRIEDSMVNLKPADKKFQDAIEETAFTSSGAETSLYDQLRKKRLEELEKGQREE